MVRVPFSAAGPRKGFKLLKDWSRYLWQQHLLGEARDWSRELGALSLSGVQ